MNIVNEKPHFLSSFEIGTMDFHLTLTMLYLKTSKFNLNTSPVIHIQRITWHTVKLWVLRNVRRLRRFREMPRPLQGY